MQTHAGCQALAIKTIAYSKSASSNVKCTIGVFSAVIIASVQINVLHHHACGSASCRISADLRASDSDSRAETQKSCL